MAETREEKLAREMAYAYSGPQPVDVSTPIGKGLGRWIPDLAAVPGDLLDAVSYAVRRGVSGNRNTPSSGLGAASRQWAKERMKQSNPRTQTELSAPESYSNPQQTALEEMVAMANPAMWNPRLLMKPEVLGGLAAAVGGVPGVIAATKKVGDVDPLAQLIASRMAGQLEGMKSLPGLSALEKVNLPAAYAGDQRSLQAAQRVINEAETGLQSPGRRKVLKQGAVMAARSAVPDVVMDAVGGNLVKNMVKDAVAPAVAPAIPDESVQAAIAAALNDVMKNKLYRRAWGEMRTHPSVSDYGDELVELIGQAGVAKLDKLLGNLTTPAIAKKYGLPEEAVQAYVDKTGISPENLLDEWANSRSSLDAFWDSTDKHRFFDYGFDEMRATDDEIKEAVKRGIGTDDEYGPLYDLHAKGHRDHNVGFYEKLLGEKGFRDLRMKQGDVFGDPLDHFEQMYDAISDNDRLCKWLDCVVDYTVVE